MAQGLVNLEKCGLNYSNAVFLLLSQRRAGCCLLCVWRSNGVVQAPRVLPGRVHACMEPMFDFVYALCITFRLNCN